MDGEYFNKVKYTNESNAKALLMITFVTKQLERDTVPLALIKENHIL